MRARNNFRKFEIVRKKVYNTSRKARRAVSENRGLRPQNRLLNRLLLSSVKF